MPPLAMLGFWTYVGIFQSVFAMLAFGSIVVAPSLWLLAVIWRIQRPGRI